MFFNSEDFNVRPLIPFQPSDEALKRWRSACAIAKNRRGRFRMVARLVNHAEARDDKLEIQDKKIISLSVRKAASQFIDDVPSSECAAPHGPHYFLKAVPDFTRSLDDVPLSEYHAKARRFQEFVDDIGSTIKGHDLKIPKRTNAVYSLRVGNLLTYPVLKATSVGVYLLSHLVFKAFSSVRNIFSNLLLGVAFVRHKFQYYMSFCKYIVTLAAKVRRMQECLNDAEYVSHDDDDSKDHPISIIMELVYNVSPNGKFRRRITSWQKGELLGSGSFGSVYEGLTDDGFFFAVKEVSLQDQGTQGEQRVLQLEQEISLLSRFEHDNIVQYFGTEKDENKLYIFLELVTKGSLAKIYQKYHLKDSQVSAYTWQILNGLKYLHEKNVIHRDIKCANILVNANGSVKLADFGLAKAITMNDVKSCKGSPFWMAPEVVNSKKGGYGLPADIWSVGCTVLEMLTRRPPYSGLEWVQALFKIARGELPPIPDSVSRDARDFILKCLQVNPNDRPTAAQLMEHPFVKRPLPTSWGLPSPHHFIMQS